MIVNSHEELLKYYKSELTYLRRMGGVFAERYPKVAKRLELGRDECADPHVERLIEAFAFLTGRLQHEIDSEFPDITSALLNILYPQLTSPIPSMSIAQFNVGLSGGAVLNELDAQHHSHSAHVANALVLAHQLFQTTLKVGSDLGTVLQQLSLEQLDSFKRRSNTHRIAAESRRVRAWLPIHQVRP